MRTTHTFIAAVLTLALALGLGIATPASADAELASAIDAVPPMSEAVAPVSSMSQGFGLFVFAGGGADSLVQAAGCPTGMYPQFWTVDVAGEFVGYVHGPGRQCDMERDVPGRCRPREVGAARPLLVAIQHGSQGERGTCPALPACAPVARLGVRREDGRMPLHGPALVTGSSGFVGGHLVARLVREGVAVTGLDSAPPPDTLPAAVRDLRIDVRDAAAVRDAVLAARPDVVYHLAAQASVSVSMREPVRDIETNVLGTVHLARTAIEAGVRRFVFVSTGGALFGEPATVPVTEALRAAPASVYGASKLAAEQYLSVLVASKAMTLSVLRPGNIYGPAQDPHGEAGVVAIFSQCMLRGEPVTIFGDGSQQRDYVYVDDVVEAALLAATGTPATCLIGTGHGTSTQAICDMLARLTGWPAAPQYAPERPGDIQRIWLDPSHARAAWGWAPRVTLDEGMARTVAWFRTHAAP